MRRYHEPMEDTRYTPLGRAALAYSVAGRELSDFVRGVVGDIATPLPPGERITRAREARVLALDWLNLAVVCEVLAGTSWDDVAESLGLPLEETLRRYEDTVEQWRESVPPQLTGTAIRSLTVGLRNDPQPEGTAAAIDAWLARDPWDARPAEWLGPVMRALTGV